jgi:uncharacterized protein YdaU (DUF1376 family)
MNFYPFHIGDYAAHTRHLSFMEDLAYRRLIDQYYLDECPLKGEPSLIARRIGMSDFSSDVQYILETFFEKEEDLWVSKRCDGEIAKYRLKADSARNANRIKSAKISALKSELKSEPNHIVTNNQEPITNINVAKATKGTRWQKGFALPDEWVEFCKKERSDLEPSKVFESFTDYWVSVAGAKGVKADWFATWRNWVRNQKSSVVQQVQKVSFI